MATEATATPGLGLELTPRLELSHRLDPQDDLQRQLLVLVARLAGIHEVLEDATKRFDERVSAAGVYVELAIIAADEMVQIVTRGAP